MRAIPNGAGVKLPGAFKELVGLHASMGSKILNGERALTVSHINALAARFKVRPDTFLD